MKKTYFRYCTVLTIFALIILTIAPIAQADLLGGNTIVTPPADTTPPLISGVATASVSDLAATIVWTTNELATSTLEYGTTQSYGSQATLDAGALLVHTATLTGLSATTTYYYCLHATDLAGNSANSCGHSFSTAPSLVPVDTTAPVISAVATASVSSAAAVVIWTTDELADGQIEYGRTETYGSTTVLNAQLGLAHTETISALSPATAYHYRIISKDAAGNVRTSPDYALTTETTVSAGVTDTTAPVISEVAAGSVTDAAATIIWSTDELATSTLEYGTTSHYGSPATLSVGALLDHAAVLTNLQPNTTYHYCIHATDLFNNTANSCNHTYTTAAAATSLMVDTTPPEVSEIDISGITETDATLNWITDEVANSQVNYGLTAEYGQSSSLNTDFSLNHQVILTKLEPDTAYHYSIRSSDEIGNATTTVDNIFTTAPRPTPEPAPSFHSPATISNIETSSLTTSSAKITWTTNLPADSQVEYGESSSDFAAQTNLDSTLTTHHSVTITDLAANSNYAFRIKSQAAGLDLTRSGTYEFTTLAVATPIVEPSNLLSVAVSDITSSQAVINWQTDKATTSHLEYGLNSDYGERNAATTTPQTTHSFTLSNLAPETVYHFRVDVTDEASNITISEDYTFSTLAPVAEPVSENNSTANNPAPSVTPVVINAPAAITNLTAGAEDQHSVALVWQLPSAETDLAAEYDVRYSTTPITESSFVGASSAQLTPIFYIDLSPTGTTRAYIVAGLNSNTTYYFALKSKFEQSDYSPLSNVVTQKTTTGASVDNQSVSSLNNLSPNSSNGNSVAVDASYGKNSDDNSAASAGPTLVKAQGVDGQIIFEWNNPGEANFVQTLIVRHEGRYPNSASDGQVVYAGRGTTFSDRTAQNGKTYYYALYSDNHAKTYSPPLKVSLAAAAGITEMKFNESGVEVPLLPILHFTKVFKKGDKNIEVEHLQELLGNEAGNVYPEKHITGYFGSLTQSAVKRFQAKYKIRQSGIVDSVTQNKLNLLSQSEMRLNVPGDYAVFNADIKLGQRGDIVSNLQQYLIYEGSYPKGRLTGRFDIATFNAVKNFQKKYKITPVSGIVSYKTRHKMQQLAGL